MNEPGTLDERLQIRVMQSFDVVPVNDYKKIYDGTFSLKATLELVSLVRAAVFFCLSALGAKGKVAKGAFLNQESFSFIHADLN